MVIHKTKVVSLFLLKIKLKSLAFTHLKSIINHMQAEHK
jgi:hypothetical protein